jgi:hypothetical protein
MELQSIDVSGNPYLLAETEKGVFYIVTSLREVNYGKKVWKWLYEMDVGCKLERGLDINEIPTRGLSILVRSKSLFSLPDIIEEARKFSYVADADYFSFENFGKLVYRDLGNEGNTNLFEVKPRLFGKIVHN